MKDEPNRDAPFGLARAILHAATLCLNEEDEVPCAVVVETPLAGKALRIAEIILDQCDGLQITLTPDQWPGSGKAVLLFSHKGKM